ncbi:EF-hand domain-containing protein [Sphingomonas sp. DT-51]|uniref:EF-hand domain-containing protein n=1 Tax=Sphingomonas sp. DT-51 TaxID=3396165 RepID=UPI003F1BB979
MWRYLVGGVAALLMVGGGWLIVGGQARSDAPLTAPAPAPRASDTAIATTPPPDLPEAGEARRAQARFTRFDRDRDGKVSRAEFLEPRRKAFAKLDRDGDGKLTFDEWAARTVDRFAAADRDHSGTLDPHEFTATAPKRKPHRESRCAEPSHDE